MFCIGLRKSSLVEAAGSFYMLQACMQGNFFYKPCILTEFRVVNHLQLHFPLLQLNL